MRRTNKKKGKKGAKERRRRRIYKARIPDRA
jgi:hypothetical protein